MMPEKTRGRRTRTVFSVFDHFTQFRKSGARLYLIESDQQITKGVSAGGLCLYRPVQALYASSKRKTEIVFVSHMNRQDEL
ncbi:hypothetical protein CEV32_1344 [Brucella rhizosphaerae]|uniref:Uncharacterized protein n=1 Tax=Brucella rhizosphaerae TaxID=571254 RepID=A0A256FBJ0_9HYPH|nr:hypothetical protein CEV32_1344 [Brucella rhizosphaerae]